MLAKKPKLAPNNRGKLSAWVMRIRLPARGKSHDRERPQVPFGVLILGQCGNGPGGGWGEKDPVLRMPAGVQEPRGLGIGSNDREQVRGGGPDPGPFPEDGCRDQAGAQADRSRPERDNGGGSRTRVEPGLLGRCSD